MDVSSTVVPEMRAVPLAHKGTGEMQVIAAVYETVGQRIGAVGLSDEFVPSLDWDLAHDDRRGKTYALVYETQEIRPCTLAELPQSEIIDDQHFVIIVNIPDAIPSGAKCIDWSDVLRMKGVGAFPVKRKIAFKLLSYNV